MTSRTSTAVALEKSSWSRVYGTVSRLLARSKPKIYWYSWDRREMVRVPNLKVLSLFGMMNLGGRYP
jgi:hypothetical protein